MSDGSRIFWVNNDSDPGSVSEDEKTILGLSVDDWPSTTRMPLEEQFTKHYQQIREWLTAHADRAGVTLLAMSPDAVHGAAFLAAKPDLVSTAIIGRHFQGGPPPQRRPKPVAAPRGGAFVSEPGGRARVPLSGCWTCAPRTGDPPRARRLAFSERRRHRGVARQLVDCNN